MLAENPALPTSVSDRLLGLTSADPNLFYFLNQENVKQVQNSFQTINTPYFAATLETLTSGPEKVNEDTFTYHDFGDGRYLFGVLDGSSSQKPIEGLEKYGLKGAFYVSHILGFGYEDKEFVQLGSNPNLSAGDVMRDMNSWLKDKMNKVSGVDFSDVLYVPGMAATLVLVDFCTNKATVAHVADTIGSTTSKSGEIEIKTIDQNRRFDEETLKFRGKLCVKYNCSLADLKNIPDAKEECDAEMQQSFRGKINQPGKCGILNGMPELVENSLIHESSFELADVEEVCLWSDGALLPYGGRGQEDVANIKTRLVNGPAFGQPALVFGAEMLMQDLTWAGNPRVHQTDDSTEIRIRINHNIV